MGGTMHNGYIDPPVSTAKKNALDSGIVLSRQLSACKSLLCRRRQVLIIIHLCRRFKRTCLVARRFVIPLPGAGPFSHLYDNAFVDVADHLETLFQLVMQRMEDRLGLPSTQGTGCMGS